MCFLMLVMVFLQVTGVGETGTGLRLSMYRSVARLSTLLTSVHINT